MIWHLWLVNIIQRESRSERLREWETEQHTKERTVWHRQYMLLLFVYKSLRSLLVYGIQLTTCGSNQSFFRSILSEFFKYFWMVWHFQEFSIHFEIKNMVKLSSKIEKIFWKKRNENWIDWHMSVSSDISIHLYAFRLNDSCWQFHLLYGRCVQVHAMLFSTLDLRLIFCWTQQQCMTDSVYRWFFWCQNWICCLTDAIQVHFKLKNIIFNHNFDLSCYWQW